jgi:hypothetical protein
MSQSQINLRHPLMPTETFQTYLVKKNFPSGILESWNNIMTVGQYIPICLDADIYWSKRSSLSAYKHKNITTFNLNDGCCSYFTYPSCNLSSSVQGNDILWNPLFCIEKHAAHAILLLIKRNQHLTVSYTLSSLLLLNLLGIFWWSRCLMCQLSTEMSSIYICQEINYQVFNLAQHKNQHCMLLLTSTRVREVHCCLLLWIFSINQWQGKVK